MYVCSNCRTQLNAQGICPACGEEHTPQTAVWVQPEIQPPQQQQQQGFPQQCFQQHSQPVQRTNTDSINTYALLSIILSSIGGLLGLLPLGAPLILAFVSVTLCAVSIYLGSVGLKQIKITGEKGKVLAIIGIVLGSIFTGLFVISFLVSILSILAISRMY